MVTGLPAFPPPSPVTLCPFSSQDLRFPYENLNQTLLTLLLTSSGTAGCPSPGSRTLSRGVRSPHGLRRLLSRASGPASPHLVSSSPGPPFTSSDTPESAFTHSIPCTRRLSLHAGHGHLAPYQPFRPRFSVTPSCFPSSLCTSAPPQLVVHQFSSVAQVVSDSLRPQESEVRQASLSITTPWSSLRLVLYSFPSGPSFQVVSSYLSHTSPDRLSPQTRN